MMVRECLEQHQGRERAMHETFWKYTKLYGVDLQLLWIYLDGPLIHAHNRGRDGCGDR